MTKLTINWVQELLPPEIYGRLLTNAVKARGKRSLLFEPCENIVKFLTYFPIAGLQGFWDATPEDKEFWDKVWSRLKQEACITDWPSVENSPVVDKNQIQKKLALNWAKELLPPEIFDRLLCNAIKTMGEKSNLFYQCDSATNFYSRFCAVGIQSHWRETPEGHHFWFSVHDRLMVEIYPPRREWPEVPEIS